MKTSQNSNQAKGFNYVYFDSWNGTHRFIWNDFKNEFENMDSIDFVDRYPYSVYQMNSVSEYAQKAFQAENCLCDGKGLQLGFYEFENEEIEDTFDVYYTNNPIYEAYGLMGTYDDCLIYIETHFSNVKKGIVEIWNDKQEKVIFRKDLETGVESIF